MGADGHVYIFFDPEDWLREFLLTICNTIIPYYAWNLIPETNPIHCFDEVNPDGIIVYWDTEHCDLLTGNKLSQLSDDTMKQLKERYKLWLKEELDVTELDTYKIHKFLDRECDINEQVWT
jgi:hypothetical protein